ncbi:hypothetical protein [Wolbachia endosymbiont (group A) of Bibio marci]|uniref:hypothetical protein n=1 Tax=Wolbachia endosymbiont (group A) of Bibio marci TaxID=2953987 RepID=UPI0022317BFC|nr:hypothetical protein [Wolbachia endosymbiont (group A) of Bibio marci]
MRGKVIAIEEYTPVSVKDRAKKLESSNKYGYVKDSKDAVPSTTNGLENESVKIKANVGILLQHSSETEEEKFISVKQRAQAWGAKHQKENSRTTPNDSGIYADESKALGQSILEDGKGIDAQDENGLTPLHHAAAKEAVPSTSSNATETPEEAEKVKKSKVKSKELRAQLKEENQSLKRKIQDLESEKATLKDKLDKTKTKEVLLKKKQKELKNDIAGQEARLEALEQEIQEPGNENTKLKDKLDKTESQYSKAEALLEKTQKELEESKSCIARHETKLKEFNKENESLRQEIANLKNENTTLKGELGKTKTKTNEVLLEKAGKRQMSFLKVASVNLVTMLTVGATLSIAFDLSVLPIIVVFVTSAALIASGVTYAISTKPTTELKEVDIQGLAQHGVCKT